MWLQKKKSRSWRERVVDCGIKRKVKNKKCNEIVPQSGKKTFFFIIKCQIIIWFIYSRNMHHNPYHDERDGGKCGFS